MGTADLPRYQPIAEHARTRTYWTRIPTHLIPYCMDTVALNFENSSYALAGLQLELALLSFLRHLNGCSGHIGCSSQSYEGEEGEEKLAVFRLSPYHLRPDARLSILGTSLSLPQSFNLIPITPHCPAHPHALKNPRPAGTLLDKAAPADVHYAHPPSLPSDG